MISSGVSRPSAFLQLELSVDKNLSVGLCLHDALNLFNWGRSSSAYSGQNVNSGPWSLIEEIEMGWWPMLFYFLRKITQAF